MNSSLAKTASLLGDPARASMLLKLMTGRALPAGELAFAANISAQTASGHLAKLVEGHLLTVQQQGRHRYYRLSRTDVADAVEALLVVARPQNCDSKTKQGRKLQPETLAHARTCYAHIAGWLGVEIAEALQSNAFLFPADQKAFAVTQAGRRWFGELQISLPYLDDRASPKLAKQCLDWTERRPHLAGTLGVAMYKRLLSLKWVAPVRDTRALRVTIEGKQQLWERLRIAIA